MSKPLETAALERLGEAARAGLRWTGVPVQIHPADLLALLDEVAAARESTPAPTEAQDCTCEDDETCGICQWDAMALRDDQDEQDAARTAPASEVAATNGPHP